MPGHWEHKGQFEMFIFGGPDDQSSPHWWPKSAGNACWKIPAERVGVSASLQRPPGGFRAGEWPGSGCCGCFFALSAPSGSAPGWPCSAGLPGVWKLREG